MKHRIISLVIAFAIGILLALFSFERISDPERGRERAQEEAVVLAARGILKSYVARNADIEVVDPLATNRAAGKAYIYPTDAGWEVSGHYRRDQSEPWHPFLMALDSNGELVTLSVRDDDQTLMAVAAGDPKLSVSE